MIVIVLSIATGCARFPRGQTPSYSVRMTVEVGSQGSEEAAAKEEQQRGDDAKGQSQRQGPDQQRVKTITIGEFCWSGT